MRVGKTWTFTTIEVWARRGNILPFSGVNTMTQAADVSDESRLHHVTAAFSGRRLHGLWSARTRRVSRPPPRSRRTQSKVALRMFGASTAAMYTSETKCS